MSLEHKKTVSLRLATRGSKLALAQADEAIKYLAGPHPEVRIEAATIVTAGDLENKRSLRELAGDGHFTRAIDQAVLEGRADFAVHSLKDLPVVPMAGMKIAAVLPRSSPADSLVTVKGVSLAAMPSHSVIGSGSLRRGAQLLRLRPDIRLAPVRGNIDSRLRRLKAGEWDGLILAEAGLRRLGTDCRRVSLAEEFLPAAGQGAVALTVARGNRIVGHLLAGVNDAATACTTTAERAFMHGLGAGCHTPVGVRATIAEDRLLMEGAVWSEDGQVEARAVAEFAIDDPLAAGRALAEKVMAAGGDRLL